MCSDIRRHWVIWYTGCEKHYGDNVFIGYTTNENVVGWISRNIEYIEDIEVYEYKSYDEMMADEDVKSYISQFYCTTMYSFELDILPCDKDHTALYPPTFTGDEYVLDAAIDNVVDDIDHLKCELMLRHMKDVIFKDNIKKGYELMVQSIHYPNGTTSYELINTDTAIARYIVNEGYLYYYIGEY